MSLFAGLIIGLVFTWIGWETIRMKGIVNKVCGAIIVLIAGIIMTLGVVYNDGGTWKRLNHNTCVQYAWLDGEWKCVPRDEAG